MKLERKTLSEQPFFKGLDERFIEMIFPLAAAERFEEGEYLFREGEDADVFYLIVQGSVALEIYADQRGTVVVETVSTGDALGWSWLIPPHHWRFDGRAVSLTRAIAIDGRRLRALCEENLDLNREMVMRVTQIIAHRLHSTTTQLIAGATRV